MKRNSLIALATVAMLVAAPWTRAEEHSHDASAEHSFELNNGQKWQMDEHTRATVGSMRKALDTSTASTVAELNALGATLQADLDTLIRGCTMTGDAHAQLHLFLSKFMPTVASLHNGTDEAAAKQALSNARHLLAEYAEFFE